MTITDIRDQLNGAWLKIDALRQIIDSLDEQAGASMIIREVMDAVMDVGESLAEYDPEVVKIGQPHLDISPE